MPVDIAHEYENKLQELIALYARKILSIYVSAINEISFATSILKYTTSTFNLDAQPLVKKVLADLIKKMHSGIYKTIINGIQQSWDLSNEKNDIITEDVVGKDISKKDIVYNPNEAVLREFIKRKDKEIDLSERVWNSLEGYKFEIEAGLTDGIAKGESAASIASKLRRYLNEPEKLFRRVRDENGKLQLSKAARRYHPGRGVYRSSFQNALRLTSTETNIAYRTADNERWNNQPFVKGQLIQVSNNHPEVDECNILAGKYPKDFLFTGWHVRCRCYATPLLITDNQIEQLRNFNLGIGKAPEVSQVDKIPASARDWIEENADRINGWKTRPYFIKDNPKYISKLLK